MRKKYSVIPVVAALSLFFLEGYCRAEFLTRTRIMMSTQVTITADASLQDIKEAFEVMAKIESLMNDYNPRSEIGILNRKGKLAVSPEVKEIILRAIYFSRITNGAFDITVGPLVRLWQKMGKEKRLPTQRELKDTLSLVGYQNIIISDSMVLLGKEGMKLDLGGIAKGYAVDKAIEVLRKRGVKNALVNAGGDLYCLGKGPSGKWKIGIQHPRNMREIFGIIRVTDKAVATSGDYRRYYVIQGRRFGHIIDPSTGWTVQNSPMSVTIVAPDCTSADALATGVFVLGLEKGIKLINSLPGVEGMIIGEGMRVVKSSNWQKFEVSDLTERMK